MSRPGERQGWSSRLAGLALGIGLVIVVGWPLSATVIEALWASSSTPDQSGASQVLIGDPAAILLQDSPTLPRPLRLAIASFFLTAAVVSLTLPIGVGLALVLARTDLWGRRVMLGLILLTAFVPLPLHATAWLGAFGNAGRSQAMGSRPILVGWWGAVVVHALAALPWVVLITTLGLRAVERELEESALLDLHPWRVLFAVSLRRSMAMVLAAALATAVLTSGDMTITDLLQVRSYAEEAYLAYSLGQGPGGAAAVALPLFVVLGGLVLIVGRALVAFDPARLASPRGDALSIRLGRARRPLGIGVWMLLGNTLALPLYALIWRAGRVGGRAALGVGPTWSIGGLWGTLGQAAAEVAGPLTSTLIWCGLAALLATSLAWGLVWASRGSRAWTPVLAAVLVVTLAAPGPVVGMALVLAYRGVSAVYDSSIMIILAETARSLPYAILLLWPFAWAFPQDYLDAAAIDGLGPPSRAWRVVLPLSAPPLAAAWVVCLVIGLGELAATNLATPPGTPPLSVMLWGLLHTGVESHLAGVALVILVVITLLGLAVAGLLGLFGGQGSKSRFPPS